MKKTLALILCLLVLSQFCLAVNHKRAKNVSQSYMSKSMIQNESDFPNIFRSIVNIFKRIFGNEKIKVGKQKNKDIEDYLPSVHALFINHNEITADCSKRIVSCSQIQTIEIETVATDPESGGVTYKYIVSAGKIIGDGAKVVWDLSGVAPGTYTITAGVDDGCGVCGVTKTQTVKIIECPNCH